MAVASWLEFVLQAIPVVFRRPPRPRPDDESNRRDLDEHDDGDDDRERDAALSARQYIRPLAQALRDDDGVSRVFFFSRLRTWLRATRAAMRPDALKELLWNGFVFLSERLLSRDPAPADSPDDHPHEQLPPPPPPPATTSPHNSVTVDRIRPPRRTGNQPPPYAYSQDYEFAWRDGPRDYITPAGFAAVASLLTAWRDDLEAGTVSRCPYADPIVDRFDADGGSSGRRETRLSAVVHNFMLERHGVNTEQAWQEAVLSFLAALEATERWIAVLYAFDMFTAATAQAPPAPGAAQSAAPYYETLRAAAQQLWDDDGCGLCGVGDFLAFAGLQTHQWGHPGMQTVQAALMQMLVDLEAVHRHQPVLSFVRVERAARAPGYLYDDSGSMVVEALTADQLRAAWMAGPGEDAATKTQTPAQRKRQKQWPCRMNGANAPLPPEALRRARLRQAAAQSIKSAHRSMDRQGSLVIAPSQPLLYERYRRLSSSSSPSAPAAAARTKQQRGASYTYPYPGVQADVTPAKRKAKVATLDPRLLKRSRLEREKRMAAGAEAAAVAAVAAAASIPLPPSPAATEASDEEEEADEGPTATGNATDREEAAKESQRRQAQQQQARRLPWTAVFPDEDDEDEDGDVLGLPRLRISMAKAEERRVRAEQRRATEQAARAKREAEQRRRAEAQRRAEEAALAASTGLRAPRQAVIGPLSAGWQARVGAAVRAEAGREVARSPEGTGLTSKDFRTVVSKSEWLNDEIVNGFLLHLAQYVNGRWGITNAKTQTPRCHAFTSFFWKPLSTRGAAGTQRWMKRVGVTRENFWGIDTILIPICEHNHWTLVVVRPGRATVTHMDSLGPGGRGRAAVTEAVLRWVREVAGEGPGGGGGGGEDGKGARRPWRVQEVGSPQQTNGWDCGVHTLTNALFVALGLDPAYYGPGEMPLQRDRIAATLLNGGFTGELGLEGV